MYINFVDFSSAYCGTNQPPTSDGHNFFVRTPFWVFLDSMEISLSYDSIHILVEDIRCQTELGQLRSARSCQVRSAEFDYI